MHMKRLFHNGGDRFFSAFFLLFLLIFSSVNVVVHGSDVWEEIGSWDWSWGSLQDNLRAVETVLNEELLLRLPLIDAYGAVQLSMGKHEENSFDNVKDKNGFLYSGNFWNGFGEDTKELAMRTKRLQQLLEKKGTKFGVVLFPMKLVPQDAAYIGIPYNDYTQEGNTFLAWIRYYNIPALDLRTNWISSGLTQEEAFFKTDHHWTPVAAFYGYRELVGWMEDAFQTNIPNSAQVTDLSQYHQVNYENTMLGSNGRKTGLLFAGGTETYPLLYPKTDGSYQLKEGKLDDFHVYEGSFVDALLDIDFSIDTYSDYYDGQAERVYLHSGVSDYVSIINTLQTSAPKLLLLRDSYATPVGAFLAQSFSQVDMLWNLSYSEEEIVAYLEENTYDYVLLAMYPENLQKNSFPFGTNVINSGGL